jgi:replicative DNA helicase
MVQQPFKIVGNSEKKMPCNIEAEQAVIASILVSNDIYDEVSPLLDSQKFFDPVHSKLYEIIEKLISKGLLANPITLKNYFENNEGLKELGGQEYLIKITKFSTSTKQAIDYANIVQEMHIRRELIKISESVLEQSGNNLESSESGEEIIQNAEKSLFDLAERGHFNQSFMKFESALKQTIEMAKSAYQNDEGIVGVPTGLTDLDSRLGGLHKQDLVIIAGRPSMGKTALATNIAFHAAKNIEKKKSKSTVAFFSLEMSSEQLSTRILSEQARIRSNDIRRGKVSEKEFEKFIETSKNIFELPLYIDETPAITIAAISNRSRRIKRLFGLELIIVDYIQLMKSGRKNDYNFNRVQEISEITQGLKALAKELNVPVLALSQLSRAVEQRDDKKPQLADLRESGSIEQDADVVMFVYRAAYYLERKEPTLGSIEHAEWQQKMDEVSRLADIMIGKQRHGPTGNVQVEFEAMYTKFKDLENK